MRLILLVEKVGMWWFLLSWKPIYFYYERDEKLPLKDDSEEMEQNVQFFKSFAHYSITHYVGRSVYLFVCLSVGPSICWSLHLLVRPFISPSIALLISDTVFWHLQVILMSLLLPKCSLANFLTTPARPTHNLGRLPPRIVFLPGSLFCRRAL